MGRLPSDAPPMTAALPSVWFGLFLGGFLPIFGSDPLETKFPLEANGNIHFRADATWFLDDGVASVDLSLSIPLDGLGASGAPTESLGLSIDAIDEEKESLERRTTTVELPRSYLAQPDPPRSEVAKTTSPSPPPRRWLRVRVPWRDEFSGLRVRLEDLRTIKAALFSQIHREHPSGELAARISQPRPGRLSGAVLSGLLFASGEALPASNDAAPGLRAIRDRLEPNPDRHYGRGEEILTVYWEHYPPQGEPSSAPSVSAPPGDSMSNVARYDLALRLPDGSEKLLTRDREVRLESGPSWHMQRYDLTPLPAGTYEVEVRWRQAAAETLRTGGRFQVLWDTALLPLDDARLLAYGRVLLSPPEFEEFAELDRGGREVVLRTLWGDAGSGASTTRSELEARFYHRVDEAERRFGGWPRGILSDRGRTLVRFGEPDDVQIELNPQDEELLWRVLPGEVGGGADDYGSRERQTRHRTPLDNSAYEIWTYYGRGDPLIASYVNPGQQMGLKFIFVDEMGIGDYTLVYTNLTSPY